MVALAVPAGPSAGTAAGFNRLTFQVLFMIYGITTLLKYALGRDRAERDFAVFPDDTMIVSYPRSGNTWTRFLIANLLHPGEQVSFANIETLIPDTSSISSRALKRIARPRIIKSHQYFDHRYPRVIYIVRDPRDVAVSFYNFQRKKNQIPDTHPLERYVHDFVHGKLNSAYWGTWGENVGSWVSTRGGSPRFLLLRYEDMLRDTTQEMSRIADFLALSLTSERMQVIIENSSAHRMRHFEKEQAGQWIATREHRKDIPFVGAAKAGIWRNDLPPAAAAEIEVAWGGLMTSLGYSLSTRLAGSSTERQSLVSR
jgi:hypothetical protein